jgi:hypothetical protein
MMKAVKTMKSDERIYFFLLMDTGPEEGVVLYGILSFVLEKRVYAPHSPSRFGGIDF